MLAIFAVIIGGIVTGRLLVGWRLAFVQRLITFIIWALLFLLGVEVGSDPAVVGSLATLGAAAFAIFALSVAGSVFAAWLLWRRIRGRAVSADEGGDADEAPVSAWTALKGSLVIVAFFVAGCVAGLFAPFDMTGSRMSAYVLYALMFCVGVTLGNDRTLAERVRRLDPRLALLPVATAVGTLAGAALAAPLLGGWSLTDSLAVGAGFGYYSLSSIFIADLRGPELATIALLCNVMREIFTLLAAPLVARWCGPLAAVSIGGATTFDTTLPVITQAALCRGFDLPRLCSRFQRPVSGDVFLYDLTMRIGRGVIRGFAFSCYIFFCIDFSKRTPSPSLREGRGGVRLVYDAEGGGNDYRQQQGIQVYDLPISLYSFAAPRRIRRRRRARRR